MLLTYLIATPFLAALFIALLPASRTRLIEKVIALACGIELGLGLLLIPHVLETGKVQASSLFAVDALGSFLMLIISLVGFFVSLYSIGYLRAEVAKGIIGPRRVRQYFILFELFLFAMYLAVGTVNPVVMWIAIEATTLATAFLISFYNKPSATEAAWKYLLLNSLGLLLGLLGTLMFLALPEEKSGMLSWNELLTLAPSMHPLAVKIAFIFVLVGYGTKIGLAPLHSWLPDAHSKAPSPISALLSGVLLNVAFFAVLRFKEVADGALLDTFTSQLLIFFGVFSIVVAALIIFIQKNYKRLLAYSSIEHMGILALGFGFGGIGIFGALLHMLYHALAKSLLFLLAGNIFLKYSTTKLKNISGVGKALPLSGVLFFGGFLMITGFPPFGIFTSKLLILSAGTGQFMVLVGVILFLLALVFFGFFTHVNRIFFGPLPEGMHPGEANLFTQVPVLLLAALIIVLSWHFPETLDTLIRAAASGFLQK
ncbi:MAG: proton-conducting transporter membrane subunit [Patescibacteria group bacterium]